MEMFPSNDKYLRVRLLKKYCVVENIFYYYLKKKRSKDKYVTVNTSRHLKKTHKKKQEEMSPSCVRQTKLQHVDFLPNVRNI